METEISNEAQSRVMGVLASSELEELAQLYGAISPVPDWRYVREPEIGLVMIRGRVSGSGAPFNFGEATVTRAIVVLASGETGYAYSLGRDREKARISAIVHAMWQAPMLRDEIEEMLIGPLAQSQAERDDRRNDEVAATKVDFFTLVRGDD